MRLSPGGVRELHWHQAAEWAYMTYGNCRVTVLDPKRRPYVADVKEGRYLVFSVRLSAFAAGLGARRLRIRHLLRRWRGERVQYPLADRLVCAHASFRSR